MLLEDGKGLKVGDRIKLLDYENCPIVEVEEIEIYGDPIVKHPLSPD